MIPLKPYHQKVTTMPKIVQPLTISKINSAKPKDKMFKLPDGQGLALWIYPSGLRSWKFTYNRDDGKRDTLTLGQYPAYSLVEARQWREDLRTKLLRKESVREVEVVKPKKHTFEAVFNEWYERWSTGNEESKYQVQAKTRINTHIIPAIGRMGIDEIKTFDIVSALRPMEASGTLETLRKVKILVGQVFAYAVGTGLIDINPVLQIGRNVFVAPQSTNYRALSPEQLPLLIDFLEGRNQFAYKKPNGAARLAIYWLLFTMTRAQEGVGAKFSEIDEAAKLWHIPAERKKERRGFTIPLSDGALWVLEQAKEKNIKGIFVFEGQTPSTHMNLQTPLESFKASGVPTTTHGLRSLARTYMAEKSDFEPHILETMLAHKTGDKVEAAYNRTDYLEKRTEAMQWWSDEIMQLVNQD